MMKKLFTLCLACMLCLTLGGCQKANDSDKGKQEKITDATQLLTAVWDTYKEDEKFPIFGKLIFFTNCSIGLWKAA